MHLISERRYNPETKSDEYYYRIKESFRDASGRVRCRQLMTVGFLSGFEPGEVGAISRGLNYHYKHRDEHDLSLFHDKEIVYKYTDRVMQKIEELWLRLLNEGHIDAAEKSIEEINQKMRKLVDVNTIKHTDAREVGAEWICLQAIRELKLDTFLASKGWTEASINTALAHLIVRTIYAPSELKTMRIMSENSAACELLGKEVGYVPDMRTIYGIAPSLYELKEELETHLCATTDTLFNITNRIVLFDLTNFYFEGRKEHSKKAQFGRSKEKRSDCKLLVLALCINTEGFIRYSSILAGNTADPDSLPSMVEDLSKKTHCSIENERTLVVLDAGIATEENLDAIKKKGYNYLCVSRKRLTNYELAPDAKSVIVLDSRKQEITLTEVKREENGDYYLRINSPAKALKECSMNRKFKERFEEELTKAKDSLSKPKGKKKYDKVVERIGRAIERYPSIARYYNITYVRNEEKGKTDQMADIKWEIRMPDEIDKDSGIYFLRTNVDKLDEKTTWDYYNLIREIECTNRQLKTDLNLRPIYHRTDERSDAHLFLGLLSYWIVNTIRYKLKQTGYRSYWTEIVRTMSTQKVITTEGYNPLGEKILLRQCSEPTEAAEDIYKRLNYKKMPFKKIRLCSTQ